MIGGKITAFDTDAVQYRDDPAPPFTAADDPALVYQLSEPEPLSRGWLAPTITVVVALASIGAMIALAWPALRAGLSPLALAQFIGALCVPPALIGVLYLMTLRTSSAEARRWGATARAMRAEADSLERLVGVLSDRIEANRAALADQTTTLVAMGESAAQRLGEAADTMRDRAQAVHASARALGDSVSGAERSVEVVLSSLPRAHDEVRGLADTIRGIGMGAGERVAALDAQLAALAERGREADTITGGAAQRLAAHLARMESTSETAGVRMEQAAANMGNAVDRVLERAADAVDEARKGIAAQGEAMLAMLTTSKTAIDRAGRDGADALGERLDAIEKAIERISLRLAEEQVRGELLVSSLTAGIGRADHDLAGLHERGMERTQALSGSLGMLEQSFAAMRAALDDGDTRAHEVIATAEALLTALDASAREMDETMPQALARLDGRIAESRRVLGAAKPELLTLVTAAESTHDAIEAIAEVISQQRDALGRTSETLATTFEESRNKAEALDQIVNVTIASAERFAEQAAPQLLDALLTVRETAARAAEESRAALARVVPDAAEALGEASSAAMRQAADGSIRRQLAELAETTEAAMHAAARASERLAEQMLALNDATAKVEERIDAARAEHEENDADHFARRVSLLIEALNSASVDIAKAFSAEVSDSAWAAYLKGDRGVFTRRAVKLLDASETREVVRLYENDDGFRDQVNRYIHDFEAMLRQILALRDGAPMSVTLISSDMGKLYVALAQSIERLRG